MAAGTSTLATLRANAMGDWEACGDCFYSKEVLYDMSWQDVDPDTKRLTCAHFGGPIAAVRDERKMQVVTGGSMRPVLRTFNASGRELGVAAWDKGRIIDWGWTSQLELVIVEETGKVLVYSMHAEKLREFTLGPAVEKEGLAQVKVFCDGLVIVTFAGNLWMVANLAEPRPVQLAAPTAPLADRAATVPLAVLEPRFSMSGSAEVLLALGSVVWQLDDRSATDHQLPLDPVNPPHITRLQLSPDGQLLALYTQEGRLLVVTSDFTRKVSEFETKADVPPTHIGWVGTDAVLLYWPQILLVIGPYGDYVSWPLSPEEPLVVVTELDGVRLISAARHELLRRVPEELVQVFRPGSTLPAAQLWDARALYEANNARSDKVLRLLGGRLPEAVNACIVAAGSELNVARQKALLRAACYGRAFCPPDFPVLLMHDTCKQLRVLNALREEAVGVPLTMLQLEALTLPVVVARLIAGRLWLLAYRIAGSISHDAARGTAAAAPGALPAAAPPPALGGAAASLSVPPDSLAAAACSQEQVLIQWACAKISAPSSLSLTDDELKGQLTSKLRSRPHIRFAPLAAHAQAVGRRKLALRLLEEETSCALQVPLLLSLSSSGLGRATQGGDRRTSRHDDDSGEDDAKLTQKTLDRALYKAIESGDTDLVYLVLFHIYKHTALPDFWALISQRALARNLFVKFCRTKEPELLETILSTTGGTAQLSSLHLERCLAAFNAAHGRGAADEAALNKLVAALGEVSHRYAQTREHLFQSKVTAEMAALRKEQARLERETGQRLYVGLSVVDTIRQCVRLGHHKAAIALKKQFAISDRRFYWLKARTLAEAHDWDALEAFAAERKSPVGWEPFLEVAKRFAAPREYQSRIIARMPDSAAKAEQYTLIDCPREAAEVAAKLSDSALFAKIQNAVSANSPAGLAIAQMKERWQQTFQRQG